MMTGEHLIYVPGTWCCPKCQFTLVQSTLNAADGSVTARDEPGDKCPNCDSPLWRVSWQQQAKEMGERAEQEILHSHALTAALTLAVRHIEHMSAWITKANADYHVGVYSFESLGEDLPGIKAAITGEVRQSPAETVSHATPQQQLDFLADEVRKALACFDRMPLPEYFDQVALENPIALAVLGAFDHLSPALNVLGLTDGQLIKSHRPEETNGR